jgi:hypothetical protein
MYGDPETWKWSDRVVIKAGGAKAGPACAAHPNPEHQRFGICSLPDKHSGVRWAMISQVPVDED